MKIPVCTPDITQEDVEVVTECAKSGWVSGISPYVDEFEKAFARYVGAKYAVASNSGSTALQLAFAGYGIGRGDQVIVPDFTMVATPNAVRNVNAKSVFVDCENDTWNINPALIEAKITEKTKAIMPVHIYGHPCKMDAIVRLAEYHKLLVIDDAAEAFGSEFCGHKVGCFTDATVFSLYANKTITAGEGGMVTTSNKEIAERMHWLRAQAFGVGRHFYHKALGYGFRMSGLQAALGNSQLKRADKYVKARRDHAKAYMDLLKPLEEQGKIVFPVEKPYGKNTYWMFTVLVPNRDKVMFELEKQGIETRPVFTPMHMQPIYKEKGEYPVSEIVSESGINLPSSNGLTNNEIHYVCEALTKCLN
jgi:perosamine synthetase